MQFFVFMYISLFSLLSVLVFIDGVEFSFSHTLLYSLAVKSDSYVRFALLTGTGAVMGGGVKSILSFHKHVSQEGTLDLNHLWGYLFSPFFSLLLGLGVYLIIQSGIAALAGVGPNDDSVLLYPAIGFICGMNWKVTSEKISKIAKKLKEN